jgi:superfamily II DNA/RNA helicase
MQQQVGGELLHGRQHVIVLSPTGSGKTLAYLLPLVQLLHTDSDDVQALVVVPGRELALQSHEVLRSLGTKLRSMAVYGGRTAMEEHRRLRDTRPQVVFGTPGRLNDHLSKSNISPYAIRYLVIDEFDKCLEMGFHDEMLRLLKSLPGLQRLVLLSATDAEQIPHFVSIDHAVRIDYRTEQSAEERMTFYEVKSPEKDKLGTLRDLLCQLGDSQSIVFLNYRDSVERVDDYLRLAVCITSAFHGGLDQRQREDALYKFSNGSSSVLVATDLASRGLDIPDVANVVHYHLPLNEDGYVHRVGRTARWDREGMAYFIVGPEEHMPEFVSASELFPLSTERRAIPQPRMTTIYIGKGKKDKLSKGDILGFLCKKGGLTADEIGRIDVNDHYAYAAIARGKLQQVLRLTKGEKVKGIRTLVEPVK